MISQSIIKEWFRYEDGKLYWIKKPCNKIKVGQKAGSLRKNGYRYTMVNNEKYGEHQLIFMLFNGYIPDIMDHVNRIRDDNHIENLRSCNMSQNNANAKLNKRNTSGYRGIYVISSGKWRARIMINYKSVHLGYFNTKEEAFEVYKTKAKEVYGEFAPPESVWKRE